MVDQRSVVSRGVQDATGQRSGVGGWEAALSNGYRAEKAGDGHSRQLPYLDTAALLGYSRRGTAMAWNQTRLEGAGGWQGSGKKARTPARAPHRPSHAAMPASSSAPLRALIGTLGSFMYLSAQSLGRCGCEICDAGGGGGGGEESSGG